jgi:hypothetical protein
MNFYVLKTKGIRGTSSPFPSNNKILFKYKINWKNLMSSKTHHSQYIYIYIYLIYINIRTDKIFLTVENASFTVNLENKLSGFSLRERN